ncbi:hypothetical protein BXO25_03800 [Xanthomonas oryzae pv. oryzae]|nr:hypothetical protein BXO25_03800 [Xanthomonas oryzae pv. oryzae]
MGLIRKENKDPITTQGLELKYQWFWQLGQSKMMAHQHAGSGNNANKIKIITAVSQLRLSHSIYTRSG